MEYLRSQVCQSPHGHIPHQAEGDTAPAKLTGRRFSLLSAEHSSCRTHRVAHRPATREWATAAPSSLGYTVRTADTRQGSQAGIPFPAYLKGRGKGWEIFQLLIHSLDAQQLNLVQIVVQVGGHVLLPGA